jgi:DNA repair protein RecO (recombination protein O)
MELEYTPAFILHTRPYKENQLLMECLVAGKGRISIIGYKGSKKNSAKSALMRPFRPLLLSFNKSSGLRTLKQIEANQPLEKQIGDLKSRPLFSGFYLNEVICRLCSADAEFEQLYPLYVYALKNLAALSQSVVIPDSRINDNVHLEWVLRQFEYKLLQMLGYGVGFIPATYNLSVGEPSVNSQVQQPKYSSADLQSLHNRLETDLQTFDVSSLQTADLQQLQTDLSNAKQVLRLCLQLHLGDKPIKSRELFRK